MIPVLTGINFDSNTDSVGGNRAHLRKEFDERIELDEKFLHFVKIRNGKIPQTVYNVSSTLGNNTLRYSINDGANYTTVTLQNGIYSFQTIWLAIVDVFEANSHYDTDATTGGRIYPFTLSVNTASSKGTLLINTNYSAYTDTIVDLTNNSTSTIYLLYGFLVGEAILDGGTATSQVSTNNANIYDSQYSIECNIVRSYIGGRKTGKTIFFGNLTASPNSYNFITAQEDIYGVVDNYEIDSLELKLVDRNGTLLVFSDNSTDANITFSLDIFK